MRKILFFCALLILCSLPAFGDTLAGGGYPVCVTKELHVQFMNAYMVEDEKECEYLLKNGCFILPGGLKITVLEQSAFGAIAKVRVFVGEEAMVMWTHIKNIKKE